MDPQFTTKKLPTLYGPPIHTQETPHFVRTPSSQRRNSPFCMDPQFTTKKLPILYGPPVHNQETPHFLWTPSSQPRNSLHCIDPQFTTKKLPTFYGPPVHNQETPHLVWTPVHNSPHLVPVLRQTNSIHAFPLYFFKIHFDFLYVSCTMPCNMAVLHKRNQQNAPLSKQYLNFYDVFYMFRTRGFIFRKTVIGTGRV